MSSDLPFDDDVTSAEEFEAALGHLLRKALRNDVDPRGAWEYRSDQGDPDWEVFVDELVIEASR